MKRLLYYILPVLLLAVVISSCRDDNEELYPSGGKDGAISVAFTVNMPSKSSPGTYALDDKDENKITEVDILAFKVSGMKEEFAYHAKAKSISDLTTNGSKKKFETTLFKDGTNQYVFVILANSTKHIDDVFTSGIAKGTEKDVILSQLKLKDDVGRWITRNSDKSGASYMNIPMWGETAKTVVQDNTTITGVSLLRMLSKVDIKVALENDSKTFTLSSVHLYNAYSNGRIVPATANIDTESSTMKVKNPTTQGTYTKGPIGYDDTNSDLTTTYSVGDIYTFESSVPYNSGNAELSKMTCVVIGGKFDGDSDATYYRVDFGTTDKVSGKTTYYDLKRNHKYEINIKRVKSIGYGTPEEAFNARAVNIEAEVLQWDEGWSTDEDWNGNEKLSTSERDFVFSKAARDENSTDNILSISTDAAGGWKVTKIEDVTDAANPVDITKDANPWVKPNMMNSNKVNIKEEMKLLVTENESGATRYAKIYIQAGRLIITVNVTQNIETPLVLKIMNEEGTKEIDHLYFDASTGFAPDAQKFKVVWAPGDEECIISESPIGSAAFDYGTNGGDKMSSLSNTASASKGTSEAEQVFTIHPPILATDDPSLVADPFFEKASKVDFTLFSNGKQISKSITLKQLIMNIVAPEKVYIQLDGGDKTFTIKANIGWKVIQVKDDGTKPFIDRWYQGLGYSSEGKIAGEAYKFKVKLVSEDELLQYAGAKAIVRVKNDEFDIERTIEIYPSVCGSNGTPIRMQIGDPNGPKPEGYLTHYFGTDENRKCWMIDNSMEGTPSYKNFPGKPEGEKGYYYSYAIALEESNCPDGWRLPSEKEYNSMLSESVNSTINQIHTSYNQYGGIYQSGSWLYYGMSTRFWLKWSSLVAGKYTGAGGSSFSDGKNGYSSNFSPSSGGIEQGIYAIRCVKDE